MKKNITINLCGRLFQIDEDACDMLQHYIDSLRSAFGKQDDGDEIADDIEARIAELFDELKRNGTEAITLQHVKEIITRIGSPEELTGEESETGGQQTSGSQGSQDAFDNVRSKINQTRSKMSGRRLYRNPNDKMVAGVMSGLAAYTDTDVTFWRLGAVLFTLCYGIGLIIYIVLAIVLPQANTPEEQLQMKGKEVNPKNLADAVVDNQQPRQEQTSGLREVFSILLKIVIGFFVCIAVIVGFALAVAFLGVLTTVVFALFAPATTAVTLPFTLGGMGLVEVWQYHPAVLIAFVVALLAVLFIPVYAIIHMVLVLTKKIKPMGVAQRIVCISLWLIALCCLVPLGGSVSMLHDQYRHERYAEDNFWMSDYDRDYLDRYGWNILKNENCHNDYVKNGEYFTGDTDAAYLDVWDARAMQLFEARSDEQPADSGTYRISCNARAEGEGVYIFVTTPEEDEACQKVMTMVPVYGNQGGKIWEKAKTQLHNDSLPIAEKARRIREVNNGKGYGWCPVEVTIHLNKPSTLVYGVSTDPTFTGKPYHSKWFSACDFTVERIEEQQN
jgi:phage shock protein PspC (stress-responsive transcriptional regulator)